MTAKIHSSSGATYTLADVRWEVREEIEAAVKRGRASGKIECGGQTYRWGDLRASNGQPILDSRAYRDEDSDVLPGWMRTPTGC